MVSPWKWKEDEESIHRRQPKCQSPIISWSRSIMEIISASRTYVILFTIVDMDVSIHQYFLGISSLINIFYISCTFSRIFTYIEMETQHDDTKRRTDPPRNRPSQR